MKRFKSPYFHDDIFFSKSGTKEVPDLQLAFENGIAFLKSVGTIPIYEKIQASRSLCDLESVLKSCVYSNSSPIADFNQFSDKITDFSKLHSLGDLLTASASVNNLWNELPIEVRENFNSNIHQFTTSIGSDEFNSKINDGFLRFRSSFSNRLEPSKKLDSINQDSNSISNNIDDGGLSNES